MDLQIEAERLKNYVLKIYPCKHDFELKVIDKRPKTLNGSYTVQTKRMRIYIKGRGLMEIKRTTIHEYAHHIHETEKRVNPNRRQERVHGPEFWRILTALTCRAMLMGIFEDAYVVDLFKR